MAAFIHTIPSILFGISTVPPIARPEGFCTDQLNWYNDHVRGMLRRGSNVLRGDVVNLPIEDNVVQQATFQDDDGTYRTYALVWGTTQLYIYEWTDSINTVKKAAIDHPAGWSATDDLKMYHFQNKVYVLNRSIDVTISTTADYLHELYSNINVPLAVGYGETTTLRLIWRKHDGTQTVLGTVSYKTVEYDGNNQAAADQSRTAQKVTTELKAKIDALAYTNPEGAQTGRKFTTLRHEGQLAINMDTQDLADLQTNGVFVIEAESSNMGVNLGKPSIYVINAIVADTLDMPKYSRKETIKKVNADPRNDRGAYFLRPVAVGTGSENFSGMAEVMWVETYDPTKNISFDIATLPLVSDFDNVTLDHIALKDRPAGNDFTNKIPAFVDNKIRAIVGMQERLGFVTADKVWWSKTDEQEQMWRESAVQVLSTDAFGVGNSGAISAFEQVAYHNKSLLLIGAKTQCKIDGDVPLTAGQTTLPVTTTNTVDVSAPTLEMGSRVYMPTSVTGSAGLLEYKTVSSTGVDEADPVSDHVKGLLRGRITEMAGNDNADLIVMRADGVQDDTLIVCNINRLNPDEAIHAWSRWSMGDGVKIRHSFVTEDKVGMVMKLANNAWVRSEVDIYADGILPANKIRLNKRKAYTVAADGDPIVMDALIDIGVDETLVVVPVDGAYPLVSEHFERVGNELHFESVAGVTYYVGTRMASLLQLSTIYRYDRAGKPIISDRLRITHIIVNMAETYRLFRRATSKYFDIPDEWMDTESVFNMDSLGELKAYTGEYRFGLSMVSTEVDTIIGTDYELDATITGLAYRANMLRTG